MFRVLTGAYILNDVENGTIRLLTKAKIFSYSICGRQGKLLPSHLQTTLFVLHSYVDKCYQNLPDNQDFLLR